MRIRLEWNVKRPSSGATRSCAWKIAGISVSMVVFELGTIWPIRIDACSFAIGIISLLQF